MRCLILIILAVLSLHASAGTHRRGGLVLQFDDGWTLWRAQVAPELAKVGGKATAFVNNQYIHNARIGIEDLRALQDEYGWEIGTHTYNHHNAIRYVERLGLDEWKVDQLGRSIDELVEAGLRVSNLAFPFNAYSDKIARKALERVQSYRRSDPLAIADGLRPDGSLPGTPIDLDSYAPPRMLKQWVDLAHSRGQLLFLYGHRVLPDDAFVTGRVLEVTRSMIVAENDIVLPIDEDIVLVPDINRRGTGRATANIMADGARVMVSEEGPDLRRLTSPGATFLIGPAYGTRMSDFKELVEYASTRLHFYTVSDVVGGKHRLEHEE